MPGPDQRPRLAGGWLRRYLIRITVAQHYLGGARTALKRVLGLTSLRDGGVSVGGRLIKPYAHAQRRLQSPPTIVR
jgi:hypothetical protein